MYGEVLKGWQEGECTETKVFRLQDFMISWVEGKRIGMKTQFLVRATR